MLSKEKFIAIAFMGVPALLITALLAGVAYRYNLKKGATAPPPPGDNTSVSPSDQEKLDKFKGKLNGFIAWSSNRTGNHEILTLDLKTLLINQVTHHPYVDYSAKISPDGSRIAFCRSTEPWVSQRDNDRWAVYCINTDGTGEKLLAPKGKYPQWMPDGRSITFASGNNLYSVDVSSGRRKLLYTAEKTLETPELSGDGRRLAVTFGGPFTAVLDLAIGSHIRMSGGCEITWRPGTDSVVWVVNGGNGGTRLMSSPADRSAPEEFMDLPGDYSHEYFPRFSRDGRWLVWAASAGGHEHDTEDYEIFIWEIGTPPESAVRITHHTGNDCWPDIYIVSSSGLAPG